MTFAHKIFNINIYNTYYSRGACNDFTVAPDEATQQWMRRYRMKLLTRPATFELIWLTAGFTNPLQLFREKMYERQLSFHLALKNPHSISYSSLSIDKARTYYFSNKYGSTLLHPQEYVTEDDKVDIRPLTMHYHKIEHTYFGKIDIQLNALCKSPHFIEEKLPVKYAIHIKAKETMLRYHFVDKENRINDTTKVVFNNNDTYFEFKRRKEQGGSHTKVYESTKPLALTDKPQNFLSLRNYDKNTLTVPAEILLEKLPWPSANTLKKDTENKLYSDIVINV